MTLATLACLTLALAPFRQDPTSQQRPDPPEVPTASDLVMRNYRPDPTDPDVLFYTIRNFAGRKITVRDPKSQNTSAHDNLQLFGHTILVYDSPENAERILGMLAELDARTAEDAARSAKSAGEERAGIEVFEYKRRYLSLDSLSQALYPLQPDQPDSYEHSMTFVKERGSVIVRDTPERVQEVKELLAQVDVPAPQVLFTCYVVSGTDAESKGESSLPKELVSGMRELVGYPHLERIAFAMLRSSATTDRDLHLELQAAPVSYTLSLRPSAYDAESGAVTLDRCSFVRVGEDDQQLLFETSTLIQAGEYTVLGATGSEPVFVVIHCAR